MVVSMNDWVRERTNGHVHVWIEDIMAATDGRIKNYDANYFEVTIYV